jgi:hypothetical protein
MSGTGGTEMQMEHIVRGHWNRTETFPGQFVNEMQRVNCTAEKQYEKRL